MFDSYRRQPPEVSLSALVDVLFILVVFVMLAANFDRSYALDVSLPAGGETGARPDAAAVLIVRASGSMTLDRVDVSESSLIARLRVLRQHKSSLLLWADGHLPLERATRLLSIAHAAGFDAVSIATRSPEGEDP